MGFEKWSWPEKAMAFWALAIASIAILIVLVSLGGVVSEKSSDVASWVQAIGSIAVIGAGFSVARFQLKEQHKNQLAKEQESARQLERKQCLVLLDAYLHVANWCLAITTAIDEEKISWPIFVRGCSDAGGHLTRLTPKDYPDPLDVLMLTYTRTYLEHAHVLLADAADSKAGQKYANSIGKYLKKLLKDSKEQVESLQRRALDLSTPSEADLIRTALILVRPPNL